MNYCWAGPKRPDGPQRMRKRTLARPRMARPRLAPASIAATDKGDPRDSDIGRGKEEDDDVARRR